MFIYREWITVLLVGLVKSQSLTTDDARTQITTSSPPTPTTPPLQPPPITNNSLFQCWTSYNDYISEYVSADRNRTPTIIPYTTGTTSSLSWDPLASFITLCDGIPRAINPPVSTSLIYTTTTDYNASQTLYLMPPLSHSSIDCNICDRCPDCNSISQFIAYSSSLWLDQPPPRTPPTLSLYLPCAPGTTTSRPVFPTAPVVFPTAPDGPSCIVKQRDPGATLFYWPVTTTAGDFCAQNGSTLTPSPTAPDGSPNTAIYNGMTLVSPTAVLIIDALTAQVQYKGSRSSSWSRIGPTVSHATLSLHPSQLSSVHHTGNRLSIGSPLTSESFDVAHLNTVPYAVYSRAHCQGTCCEDCGRIWDVYRPKVGVPEEVTGLRGEWEFCVGWGSVRPVGVAVTAGVKTDVVVETPGITGGEEGLPIQTGDGW